MTGSAENIFINPGFSSWEPGNDVHVWRFPLAPGSFYFLNEEERAFAQRFRFDEDRIRFSVGRQSLRLLLSKYLSAEPLEIKISGEKNLKPFIVSPSSGIYFNTSHSGGWVLIAIAKDEIGIDIELVDDEFSYQEILTEHFSKEERGFISNAADPRQAFYYLWTRKEALTKAWGTGLQENLKDIIVLNSVQYIDPNNRSWKLKSFNLSPAYPAALACPGNFDEIIFLEGRGLFNAL